MKEEVGSMRIGFIARGGVANVPLKEKADVILCAFHGDEVVYEKELKGETDYFERVARVSKTVGGVVVCGCKTNARGHKRKSALVVENGTVLGVNDTLHAIDNDCSSGAEVGIYQTQAGKMGVVVAGDLRFPEVFKTLSLCGVAFVVCPYEKAGERELAIIRAHAYCFGVPVYFCGEGQVGIALPSGELAFSSEEDVAFAKCKNTKEYHLVETRRKL